MFSSLNKRILQSFIFLGFLTAVLPAQERPEPVELRVDPAVFSPNTDGIKDLAFISPVLQSHQEITRWRADIFNGKNKLVARLTGAGFSALVKWDGTDKNGSILPDGTYFLTYRLWGKGLKWTSKPMPVVIDTNAPKITLSVSTPVVDVSVLQGNYIFFSPQIEDSGGVDMWQVQVVNPTGRTVFIEFSSGTIHPLLWNGLDRESNVLIPMGAYTVVAQAWDKAGNESNPAFASFTSQVSPRDMLKGAIHYIQVRETEIGLLVQLPSKVLFYFKDDKPKIRNQSEFYLNEVALLINAYSESDVRIDGYSRVGKQPEQDRDVSSMCAWNVYSYLVKEGHVKPSRLTVRGRGRYPLQERKEVNPPALGDGVEIILEGADDWK